MDELSEQPDMLVAPDGESVESVGAIERARVDELLAAGWRRVPFAQFLQETSDRLGIPVEESG